MAACPERAAKFSKNYQTKQKNRIEYQNGGFYFCPRPWGTGNKLRVFDLFLKTTSKLVPKDAQGNFNPKVFYQNRARPKPRYSFFDKMYFVTGRF